MSAAGALPSRSPCACEPIQACCGARSTTWEATRASYISAIDVTPLADDTPFVKMKKENFELEIAQLKAIDHLAYVSPLLPTPLTACHSFLCHFLLSFNFWLGWLLAVYSVAKNIVSSFSVLALALTGSAARCSGGGG